MVEHKGMNYIVVKNKIFGSVLNSNIRLHTTKKDKETHGLGVNSIIELVCKMDGFCQSYEEQDIFTTFIFIPFASCKT